MTTPPYPLKYLETRAKYRTKPAKKQQPTTDEGGPGVPMEMKMAARMEVENIFTKFWKPKPCHTIFSDSRGHSRHGSLSQGIIALLNNLDSDPIQRDLWEKTVGVPFIREDFRCGTFVFPGAKLQQLIALAANHLKSHPRDVIYILGGACNLTTKDKASKVVSFNWDTPEKLSSHLWAYSEFGLQWLAQHHPAATVVMCPLTGSYLPKMLPLQAEKQPIIDVAVRDFNKNVIGINRRAEVAMPWLHKYVHKTRHGQDKDYYLVLPNNQPALPDGLHPSQELLNFWARDFVTCFAKNFLAPSHDFQ